MNTKPHYIAIVKQADKEAEQAEVKRRFLAWLEEQIVIEYDSSPNGYIDLYKCKLETAGKEGKQ